jgi:ArsR family transcriptional regulator
VANASQHLKVLRSARLVTTERSGLHVHCRLASDSVEALWQSLQRFGEERLLEVKELLAAYLERRDTLEAVSREQLIERAARGEVIVLDVRPPLEFEAGHLPGALSIPLAELEARLGELPPEREVVAYCRGPYCLLAFDAVELLRTRGYRASRLEGGFPEWKAHQLPVEIHLARRDA